MRKIHLLSLLMLLMTSVIYANKSSDVINDSNSWTKPLMSKFKENPNTNTFELQHNYSNFTLQSELSYNFSGCSITVTINYSDGGSATATFSSAECVYAAIAASEWLEQHTNY